MMTIEIKLEVDERTLEMMDRKAREIFDEFMREVVDEIMVEAQNNLLENESVVTGQLLGSKYVKKLGECDYEFGFDCPYAGFVEYGTAPRQKMPPVEKLTQWAKIKFGLAYHEARKVAWRVAKWIKEHGTQPHPFVRPAIYKVISKYRDIEVKKEK